MIRALHEGRTATGCHSSYYPGVCAPDAAHPILAQLCREESTTLESLQAALAVFDRKYTATAVGPAKWKRHAEFMRDSYAACVRDLALRINQRAAQEAAAAANRAQQAQAALRQVPFSSSKPWYRADTEM